MKKILSFFSYVFHPMFISVYAVLLYFFLTDRYHSYQELFLIMIQIIILTILIPISMFYFLMTLGKANSLMLSEITQRKIPLAINAFLLYILITQSIREEVIPELYFFFFGALASTIITFLLIFVNLKASIHMIGISSITIFIIGFSLHTQVNHIYLVATFLLLTGIVATSRLSMKAHDGKELIAGFLVGVLPQIGLLSFWL
ncbi:hypothetical protein [Flavobacterium macacae]|uniref:Transmembrane protein n=1 Tax=Flavobacterium macacae TaxID=2488993 RepID=A0A3P3WH18_9FLAO|nr:hypothetical protein [Flavobacterium macacae]RRJ93848.1 hypothetical protein EG849_03150 [Flavobacterium macacae]